MASTCSPTSLQLRLAMNCKNHRGSPPDVLIWRRVTKLNPCIRTIYAVQYGNGVERRRDSSGNPWDVSCAAADNFADGCDQSVESQRKKRLPGIVGAGVAGVILVAGLTFAALSLSKRSTLRRLQHMEPLTAQQEASLVSTYEDDRVEVNKGDESSEKQDGNGLERFTSIDKDLSSSQKLQEAPVETELKDSHQASAKDNSQYTVSSRNTIDDAHVQEDMKYESPFDDKLETPEMASNSLIMSNFEITDHSLPSSVPHSISEVELNQINDEPADLLDTKAHITGLQRELGSSEMNENEDLSLDSSDSPVYESSEPVAVIVSVASTVETGLAPGIVSKDENEIVALLSEKENLDSSKTTIASTEINSPSLGVNYLNESGSSGTTSVSEPDYPSANEQDKFANNDKNRIRKFSEPPPFSASFSTGIPAPSAVSEALQVSPGEVLVPAVVDQAQERALAALQVLKVIEVDAQPSDLCTRREYARWLVAASNALSRSTRSKVYPAMYIENATELAFDDVTHDDPDFSSIQGLAEAGLISSRLSSHDLVSSSDEGQGPFYFSPDSRLSRQDLVSWKMALEKIQLPEADRKILYQLSGFRDIGRINPDAWPALIADLCAADHGIISLAFGCTRLFQPDKPVTKAQAAVALATGEASDMVNEELARIEAESMAESAVSAHDALVDQVEQDINASFEKKLSIEREKINVVERMAEEGRLELERLRSEREADNVALMKEWAAVEAEMETLSGLRHEVEEQLQGLLSSKLEISYEKERISKLRKQAENEKQEIFRLHYELEVERKALSMARAWAEDEAKRAREHARAIEEARDHWQRQGIKVIVDSNLRDDSSAGATWATAGEQFSTEGMVSRAENLINKLKLMADDVKGKSKEVIRKIIQMIQNLVLILKEWTSRTSRQAKELKDSAMLKAKGSLQELQQNSLEVSLVVKEKARGSIQGLQHCTADLSSAVMEGAKKVAGDCRESVEKLTQKFKS